MRETSRAFLVPWEPTWPSDDLSRSAFRRRLKRYAEDARSDLAYAFLIFRSDDNALVGGLTLANIRRGVAQAGSIGYWIGAPFARKGYHERGDARFDPVLFRLAASAPAGSGLHPGNAASVACWRKPAFSARAMRAAISASTASGRTICSMPGSRTIQTEPGCLWVATLSF